MRWPPRKTASPSLPTKQQYALPQKLFYKVGIYFACAILGYCFCTFASVAATNGTNVGATAAAKDTLPQIISKHDTTSQNRGAIIAGTRSGQVNVVNAGRKLVHAMELASRADVRPEKERSPSSRSGLRRAAPEVTESNDAMPSKVDDEIGDGSNMAAGQECEALLRRWDPTGGHGTASSALQPSLQSEAAASTREFRLMIVSAGGSGTTYLMEALRNVLEPYGYVVTAAASNFKHVYADPKLYRHIACWRPDRILYVMGDPLRAVLSLARRGYLSLAERFAPFDEWIRENPEALQSLQPFIHAVIAQRRDIMGRKQHMLSWVLADLPAPLLVMDFESIVGDQTLLSAFLSVPQHSLTHIKKQDNTHYDITDLPAEFVRLYDIEYEQMSLYDRLLVLPPRYQDRLRDQLESA